MIHFPSYLQSQLEPFDGHKIVKYVAETFANWLKIGFIDFV